MPATSPANVEDPVEPCDSVPVTSTVASPLVPLMSKAEAPAVDRLPSTDPPAFCTSAPVPESATSPSSVPALVTVPADEFSVLKPRVAPAPTWIALPELELFVSVSIPFSVPFACTSIVPVPWLVRLSSPAPSLLAMLTAPAPPPATVIAPSLVIVPTLSSSSSALKRMPVAPVLKVTVPVAPMSMLPASSSVSPSL